MEPSGPQWPPAANNDDDNNNNNAALFDELFGEDDHEMGGMGGDNALGTGAALAPESAPQMLDGMDVDNFQYNNPGFDINSMDFSNFDFNSVEFANSDFNNQNFDSLNGNNVGMAMDPNLGMAIDPNLGNASMNGVQFASDLNAGMTSLSNSGPTANTGQFTADQLGTFPIDDWTFGSADMEQLQAAIDNTPPAPSGQASAAPQGLTLPQPAPALPQTAPAMPQPAPAMPQPAPAMPQPAPVMPQTALALPQPVTPPQRQQRPRSSSMSSTSTVTFDDDTSHGQTTGVPEALSGPTFNPAVSGGENVVFCPRRGKWLLKLGSSRPEDFHYSPTYGGYYFPIGSAVQQSKPPPTVPTQVHQPLPQAPSAMPPAEQWEDPFIGLPKVVYKREHRRVKHPLTDPDNIYKDPIDITEPWGFAENGGALFKYDPNGQLYGEFTAQDIRQYIDHFTDPNEFTIWLQHYPAQCSGRTGKYHCMWEGCPITGGTIYAGDYQVAFDEYPLKTTRGYRDPFKVAGHMHLYCYEKCFDPVFDHLRGVLRPDTRTLPREERNPMAFNLPPCRYIVKACYEPWMQKAKEELAANGIRTQAREHEDTLYRTFYMLARDNENQARKRRRAKSNGNKEDEDRRTVDVIEGNLGIEGRFKAKHRQRDEAIDDRPSNMFQIDPRARFQPDHVRDLLAQPTVSLPATSAGRKRRRPIEEDDDDDDNDEAGRTQRRRSKRLKT